MEKVVKEDEKHVADTHQNIFLGNKLYLFLVITKIEYLKENFMSNSSFIIIIYKKNNNNNKSLG